MLLHPANSITRTTHATHKRLAARYCSEPLLHIEPLASSRFYARVNIRPRLN